MSDVARIAELERDLLLRQARLEAEQAKNAHTSALLRDARIEAAEARQQRDEALALLRQAPPRPLTDTERLALRAVVLDALANPVTATTQRWRDAAQAALAATMGGSNGG